MNEQDQQPMGDQPRPELLFHYTGETGLFGILESDCIWATHYQFLNDRVERQLGLSIYESTISKKALEHFGSADSRDTLIEYFRRSCSSVLDAFVVSFCSSYSKEEYQNRRPVEDRRGGDRLSQWRGYAAGTQGYCLALDFQLLPEIQQRPQDRGLCYYSFCTYLEDSAGGMVETHVKEIFQSAFTDLTNDDLQSIDAFRNALDQNQTKKKAMDEFLVDVLLLCGVFKHAGFQEENEYRLMKLRLRSKPSLDVVYFRNGLFDNTPYIKIPLALASTRSPLKAVFVGPHPDMDQNAISLQFRLRQMGLAGVEVVPSRIPYRSC